MIKTFLRAFLKPFSFLPALFMMYMIFSFSSQDGTTSGNLSYKVSEIIVESANEAFELQWSGSEIRHYIERIHHPVRKLAHMTEYFLLAVSVSFPLYVYGVRGLWLPLLAGGICVGFAALDEYHQSFVAGRGPSKKDVGIDSIGVLAGVLMVQFFCFIGRLTIFRPLARKRRSS
jgi:VanZ family protein